MEEKEREKNETEKRKKEKERKKSSNAGIEPATSLSAAGHHYHIATASGIDCTY